MHTLAHHLHGFNPLRFFVAGSTLQAAAASTALASSLSAPAWWPRHKKNRAIA